MLHTKIFSRNHRVAVVDAAGVTLRVTHTLDIAEQLGAGGLIRSLAATDTQLFVGTVSGNEGVIVFSSWPIDEPEP
jgi:hypothetical protein